MSENVLNNLTDEQRLRIVSLHSKWANLHPYQCPEFEVFKNSVTPVIGGDGAVAVPWCGMDVCIEKDGYPHT